MNFIWFPVASKISLRSHSPQYDNFSKEKYELLTFYSLILIFPRLQFYIAHWHSAVHINETCLHKQEFLRQSSKLKQANIIVFTKYTQWRFNKQLNKIYSGRIFTWAGEDRPIYREPSPSEKKKLLTN